MWLDRSIHACTLRKKKNKSNRRSVQHMHTSLFHVFATNTPNRHILGKYVARSQCACVHTQVFATNISSEICGSIEVRMRAHFEQNWTNQIDEVCSTCTLRFFRCSWRKHGDFPRSNRHENCESTPYRYFFDFLTIFGGYFFGSIFGRLYRFSQLCGRFVFRFVCQFFGSFFGKVCFFVKVWFFVFLFWGNRNANRPKNRLAHFGQKSKIYTDSRFVKSKSSKINRQNRRYIS